MLLQVDSKLPLTLVIRGVNSEQKLREALVVLPQEDLFPLSLLVQNLEGGKQYYSVSAGGYTDNGVRILKELVRKEVENRARGNTEIALEYTKYVLQRGGTFALDHWVPTDTRMTTIQQLFDYAFSVGDSYVQGACHCVDVDNICVALPPPMLFQLTQLVLDSQSPNIQNPFPSRLLDYVVQKLRDLEHPLPKGVLEYGIEDLEKEYQYDKIRKYALSELIKCYRQSKSSSIIEEVKTNVEVVK